MFDPAACDVAVGKYGPPPDDLVTCTRCNSRVDVNECTELKYLETEYLCQPCASIRMCRVCFNHDTFPEFVEVDEDGGYCGECAEALEVA